MKIEGYVLVNKNNKYLATEQDMEFESNGTLIWCYQTSNIDQADLFDMVSDARDIKDEINSLKPTNWRYQIEDEEKPVKIVKVTKLIHIEEVL